MEEFDYRKFLVENKLTPNSRLLKEKKESSMLNEIDFSFWDAFVAGIGLELGRYALELGISIVILTLGGVSLTAKAIISKVKELIRDRKSKEGAVEAQKYLISNPIIKELIQQTKEVEKLRTGKVDKRKKDAEEKLKNIKELTKQAVAKRQEIAQSLLEDIKDNKLSKDAVKYLANQIPYIKNSGYFNNLMESGNEEEQLLSEEFDAFTREELDALQQYEDTGMFPEWLSDEEGDALVAKWRAEYEDDFTDPAGGSGLDSHV